MKYVPIYSDSDSYRNDSSNTDTDFLRNRIRHELLPYLATYNPSIRDRLLNTAEALAADEVLLEELTDAAFARHGKYQKVRRFSRFKVSHRRQAGSGCDFTAVPFCLPRVTLTGSAHAICIPSTTWCFLRGPTQPFTCRDKSALSGRTVRFPLLLSRSPASRPAGHNHYGARHLRPSE